MFSGAGGLGLGFKRAGFKVVGAIDCFKDACTTLRKNNPEIDPNSIICDDITRIDPKEMEARWGNNIDLVIGGPPCQGLSLAGKRLAHDPRNYLFLSFVRFVIHYQPSLFVMENVPGLLSMNNGELLEAIVSEFSSIGYKLHTDAPILLDAASYGVPQFRKRIFFVGIRNQITLDFPPTITHGQLDNSGDCEGQLSLFENGDLSEGKLEPWITVAQAISDLPSIKSGEGFEEMSYPDIQNDVLTEYQKKMRKDSLAIYNHVSPKHTDKLIELVWKAQQNQLFGLPIDPNYSDSKMWNPLKPSFTIKALGQGGGSTNRRAFHYRDVRGSTVRENARIQSFPDKYRFYGSKTNQMTQVGNAVPPILAEAIAKAIYKALR